MLLTQTNWLRMPGYELGSSLDALNGPHSVGTTLLKKHKILPHPREERISAFYPITPAVDSRELSIDTSTSSMAGSDTSSPRILKHTSKRIGALPPTPPTHSRQSSGSHSLVISIPKYDVTPKSSSDHSVPCTPPNQRSPPTPDGTPPRAMIPLAFRPPIADRYPSSRADSFRTAPENPYSSDEEIATARPALPSTKPSEVVVPPARKKSNSPKRRDIGLGLGLESTEGSVTPRPQTESESQKEFVVFDGEWGSPADDVSEVEREWDDNLMRNVTVKKRRGRNLHMLTDGTTDEVIEDNVISPTMATKVVRSLPLQERIAKHRLERELVDRIPSDKFPGRSTWPALVSSTNSPATPDVRRFSSVSTRSGTSAIVEAIVVDAPPQRTRTLRKSKRQIGLRDLSSDQSTFSTSSSVISSEPPHRLIHKDHRIPERRDRSQVSTNTTVSTGSSSNKSRREIIKKGGIPVVVIPDRTSSTKSSKAPSLRSTSSRKTKRSLSIPSAPLSQSSKFNDPNYFDVIPPRKRTMSESAGSGNSVRTIDYPPSIPARRSSLSAPTSRNTSRAGSLTAESLKAHNLLQEKKVPAPAPIVVAQPPAESERDTGPHSGRLVVDHNGDPFFGNRLSTQVTPFSQVSYDTVGTAAEVSEAMAISLFPHQNKSVLMVQHESSTPPELKPLNTGVQMRPSPPRTVSEQPKFTLNDSNFAPVTPPQSIHPMDQVDSPLRNPRAPPPPPAIQFIPPTPSDLSPGAQDEHQLGFNFDQLDDEPAIPDDEPKRGFLRRAFSTRRNSESALGNSNFLQRTFSLSGRRKDEATQTSKPAANPSTIYPSVLDHPADGSKLHPFWRPTHFWDDLEDRDDMDDEEYEARYPPITNRPVPKRSLSARLKHTFAILPIEDDSAHPQVPNRRTIRRSDSGNLRVVKSRSNNSLRGEIVGERKAGQFGYGFKEGNGGRIHTIPGLGLRVEYIGWSGIRRRMSERRREMRKEKLRSSISSPRAVRGGVEEVLRTTGRNENVV